MRYVLQAILTFSVAGVVGYAAGDILGAMVAIASAYGGLIQKNPTDPRLESEPSESVP